MNHPHDPHDGVVDIRVIVARDRALRGPRPTEEWPPGPGRGPRGPRQGRGQGGPRQRIPLSMEQRRIRRRRLLEAVERRALREESLEANNNNGGGDGDANHVYAAVEGQARAQAQGPAGEQNQPQQVVVAGPAQFMHRELLHLLPLKVKQLEARLLTDPMIPASRQMQGCFSFDIYCRTSEPKPVADGAASFVSPFLASHEEEVEEEDKKPAAQSCNGDQHQQQQTQEPQDNNSTPKNDDQEQEPNPSNTHQFMSLGRWQDRDSYERHMRQRIVQKFCCSIMDRRVFRSFPILSMWSKQNGSHTPFQYTNADTNENNVDQVHQEAGNNIIQRQNTTITEDHNHTPQPQKRRFVMTRKRLLKHPDDANHLQTAIRVCELLAKYALMEEGCLAYDVCVTGNNMFNEGEVMLVGVWDSKCAYLFHNQQHYRDLAEFNLIPFFDALRDELSCWESPSCSCSPL
jgi:quinol monooxygenase YgiN